MAKSRISFSYKTTALVGLLLCGLLLLSILMAQRYDQDPGKGESEQSPPNTAVLDREAPVAKGISGQVRIVDSTDTLVSPELTNLLIRFMDAGFEALGRLEERDITACFTLEDEAAQESALLNQTALDYLVKARRMQPLDLSFASYSYTLHIVSAETRPDDKIELWVEESHAMSFAATPQVQSATAGIEHRFVAGYEQGQWQLYSHQKVEDVYMLVEQRYQEAEANTQDAQQTLEKVSSQLVAEASENVHLRKQWLQAYLADPQQYDTPRLPADNPYDRQAAVEYAMQWVAPDSVVRNNQWQMYDYLGGNCNNYTSQCLYAGGIPMDVYGAAGAQWKWYGDSFNGSETPRGRVASWSGVEEFYQYALYNTGYGLVAWVDDNLYSGQPGDVLQYGTGEEWKHSVLITQVLRDQQGNPVDYLIASNTADRVDYPASAYSYPRQRLIKIYGWNN